MKSTRFSVATAFVTCGLAFAQTPTFVKDLSTAAANPSSSPGTFCVSGSRVFMVAFTNADGAELWTTDGTAGGTQIVTDPSPGISTFVDPPFHRIAFNGGLLFQARDFYLGKELWFSDGTSAGTSVLKDINPGSNSSTPDTFFALGGRVIFIAGSNSTGDEWWVTDGTTAGTQPLLEIVPGSNAPNIQDATQAGNQVFFAATDANGDRELWATDGTTAGTRRVKNIDPLFSSSPETIRPWGNRVVFAARVDGQGRELWVSDGTESGTTLIADVTPGPNGSTFSGGIATTASRIYFGYRPSSGPNQLWWSNGTAAGTQVIQDGGGQPLVKDPDDLWSNGTRVFLTGGLSGARSVWTANGNVGGTVSLCPFTGSHAVRFQTFENRTIFQNRTAAHGLEMWVTDGTPAGTSMVDDMTPGTADGSPYEVCPIGGGVALAGMLGNRTDYELWRTTALPGGTTLVADINRNNGDTFAQLTGSLGDELLFVISNASTSTLWKSDGSEAGTVAVRTFEGTGGGSSLSALTELNGKIYFQAPDAGNLRLWVTDGTTPGTHLVATGDEPATSFESPVKMGGEIYYLARSAPYSWDELWATDGTGAGTRLVFDISGEGSSSTPFPIGTVNGKLIFSAVYPGLGRELWSTDGSAGSEVLLHDIRPGNGSGLDFLNPTSARPITVGGLMYFAGTENGDSGSTALWVTDGTPEGTTKVGTNGGVPSWLAEFQGTAFFTRNGELWSSDGTAAGTTMVVPFIEGGIRDLVATPSYMYFTSNPAEDAVYLWRSDGTEAGTSIVDTIWPFGSGRPTLAVIPGGPVYFFGARHDTGAELFRTNGTAETTVPVEIFPGPRSSMPRWAQLAGERFFWFGTDEDRGQELWTIGTDELMFDDCAVDFDGDGFVTGLDFDLYVQAYEAGEASSDFDGDGFVTGIDYDLYVQAFEIGC